MHNTTHFAWHVQLLQGLIQSMVLLDLTTQPFTADTAQAQGISVPIFRESCVSRPLT